MTAKPESEDTMQDTNKYHIEKTIPLATAAVGVAALVFWLVFSGNTELEARVPGRDSSGERPVQTVLDPTEHFEHIMLGGSPADLPGAWPGFRGKNNDNISNEPYPLARKWPDDGPKELWSIDVGEGHAGAAVLNGCVYMIDYDREKQRDVIRCLSLADGKDIWQFSYPVKIKRNHGMSRTIPAVTDKYVVSMGPKCHVTCLDVAKGKLVWFLDLVKDFNTVVPDWYAGQCPLIDDGKAILAPCGVKPDEASEDATADSFPLMMAVDCATGDIVWKTPNPEGWKMSHTSVVPMTFNDRKMYVYSSIDGVVGVSAEDGEVLWTTTDWKIRIAAVASPVPVGDGKLFLSGGYNVGSMMLQLAAQDGGISAKPLFTLKPEVFGSPQHTPILYKDHIFGVRPDGEMTCLNLDGEIAWTSGRLDRFGLGPYMIADGIVFLMDDNGSLTIAEASVSTFRRLDRAKVLRNQHDTWAPMAIAGGSLILRGSTKMVCLDVRSAPMF